MISSSSFRPTSLIISPKIKLFFLIMFNPTCYQPMVCIFWLENVNDGWDRVLWFCFDFLNRKWERASLNTSIQCLRPATWNGEKSRQLAHISTLEPPRGPMWTFPCTWHMHWDYILPFKVDCAKTSPKMNSFIKYTKKTGWIHECNWKIWDSIHCSDANNLHTPHVDHEYHKW